MTADQEPRRSDDSEGLARLCETILSDFIADPARNNMGPGRSDPAWEGFLLGFAAGDDPLWDELKIVVGPQHWTPVEAFAAAGRDGGPEAGDASAAGDGARTSAGPSPAAPAHLTVVSWAICQTQATKAANRLEISMPSEPWARSRIYGQEGNRALHLVMLDALRDNGYEAVAPSLLPSWAEADAHTNHWRSTWSERHVAYVGGLGTFGLSGGLITRKGQAVRLGSVVVEAVIPATPRPYDNPFAYCLHFSGDGCAECAVRCPTGSVSIQGRDKEACAYHLRPRSEEYVKRQYGFDGYGCGLCQTGVPCESGIPEGLAPPVAAS
jgi:epoxyqueuosine reductase